MRITALTCVKNEGPFLLEWIAFNRIIGVRDFLFYSNDCTDGTDDLLDALAVRNIVHHRANPAKGRNYQMEALKDAPNHDVISGADWVWVSDVDEFLNIHIGNHTLPALIAACKNASAISLNFQYFANDSCDHFVDGPIIEQFTKSHNPDLWGGEKSIEVKTLTHRDFPLHYFGAHRPFFKSKPRLKWADGSGNRVPSRFYNAQSPGWTRKFPAADAREFATLNHYALRSLDSYMVKFDRGDVNRQNRDFGLTYWRERNDNAYNDASIHRYLPALRKEISNLMKYPEIKYLHDQTVAMHRKKCASLMTRPAYQDLRAALKSASTLPIKEEALLRMIGVAI